MKQKYIFLFILITFISMMTACKDPATQAEVSPLPPIKIDEPSTPVPITDSSEPADNSLEPTPCSPTNPYIEERLGFTGSNIAAGGLIAGDGENWVYYRSELDHWSLYKAHNDGTQKTMLLDGADYAPGSINVLNGWVYFSNFRDGFSIYRVRDDGTDVEKLVDGYCYTLFVAESGIYFDWRDENNRYRTFRMDLDGSNQQLILEGAFPVSYFQGVVYCIDSRTNELLAYHIDTEAITSLMDDMQQAAYFSVDETGVYYWDDMTDYCHFDPADGQVDLLHSGPIGDYYNYADGKLYYQAYGGPNYDFYCCYVMDVVTGEKTPILSLSEQLFNKQGQEIGVTNVDYRNGGYDSTKIPKDDMGFHDFLDEMIYSIYSVNGQIIVRGRIQEGMLPARTTISNTFDCWILCDGEDGQLWD